MHFTDTFQLLNTAPYSVRISHIALALLLGLLVGLERERHEKQAGIRTFAFVAMIGAIGAVLGESFALVALILIGMLVGLMNVEVLIKKGELELTTSAALIVTGLVGILCGFGLTLTPVAIGIVTAGLLAWKRELAGFTLGLTESELRAAIVLAVLAFVIYPILPNESYGPKGMVDPREAWITVVLVAAFGFVNYVLWKVYGSRGALLAGFFGGLINSTVTAAELVRRNVASKNKLSIETYSAVLLSTSAMALRNGVLLAVLEIRTLRTAALPIFVIMLMASSLAISGYRRATKHEDVKFGISAPFSLRAALQFGVVFLVLQVVGGLSQDHFGHAGFYVVSAFGGMVSSASAVASAGALAAKGTLSFHTAGLGAVIAMLASVMVQVPVVVRWSTDKQLIQRLVGAMAVIVVATTVVLVASL